MSIYPKIYFGPMSKNIVDVLLEMSIEYPIGLIPSRRQVEFDGGYVNGWTSQEFHRYVKQRNENCLVCRDHGGRLQGKEIDDGLESLLMDSQVGFDILHIDPWKKFETLEEVALETSNMIKKCLSVNPKLKFEIGTEEAICHYTSEQLRHFLQIVKDELGEDFQHVLYAVVQFGTRIVGTKNVGAFDKQRAKRMVEVTRSFSLLSKEHNGDYLTSDEIKERFSLGLDAINIAPEFGTLESTVFMNMLIDNLEMKKLDRFFEICYNSNKWCKWMPKTISRETILSKSFYGYLLCKVSGHYNFSNQEIKSWKMETNMDEQIKKCLDEKINKLLTNIYERI